MQIAVATLLIIVLLLTVACFLGDSFVSWCSKKKILTGLSSNDSDYRALADIKLKSFRLVGFLKS